LRSSTYLDKIAPPIEGTVLANVFDPINRSIRERRVLHDETNKVSDLERMLLLSRLVVHGSPLS
jgi:hypothetical protein